MHVERGPSASRLCARRSTAPTLQGSHKACEEEAVMQVGFIGLGIMGASMASNLQKAGFKLVVHDLQRQNAGTHLAAGAQWAATPKEVAQACEVVFTSLPGPAEFEAVAMGKDGLAEGFKKGSALFDLTTNAPSMVRKTQLAYAKNGLHL